ncbi:MAG: hypothetical protein HY669_04280 [Chloroflexi bacterium]|nr:hypothetical protein [Chloroflexota bacterium]
MKKFNWRTALLTIAVAGLLIGSWLFMLVSETLITVSRGRLVMLEPTSTYMVVTTFAMLLGVVLLSIQIASILEYAVKGKQE